MIIFKYNIEKNNFKNIHENFIYMKNTFPEEDIIAIPYGIDILTDCTLDELYKFRNDLDNIIERAEEKL